MRGGKGYAYLTPETLRQQLLSAPVTWPWHYTTHLSWRYQTRYCGDVRWYHTPGPALRRLLRVASNA